MRRAVDRVAESGFHPPGLPGYSPVSVPTLLLPFATMDAAERRTALTSQLLADVVSTLNQFGEEERQSRTATRIEVECRILVWPIVDGRSGDGTSVLACDISAQGIGLMQGGDQPLEGRFVAQLPRRRREPILISCRTVHTSEVADGVHVISAVFEHVLSSESQSQTPPNEPSDMDVAAS